MSRRLFIESLFDRGLVNEHYGDIVADGINAFTFDALQRVPIGLEFDLRLASRTREYLQEFLTNCHGLTFLSGMLREMEAYHKESGRRQQAGAGAEAHRFTCSCILPLLLFPAPACSILVSMLVI
jgi:hypothetical protein